MRNLERNNCAKMPMGALFLISLAFILLSISLFTSLYFGVFPGIITLIFWSLLIYHAAKKYDIGKEEKRVVRQGQRRIEKHILTTAGTYAFYCSKCLYQTNDFDDVCPRCNRGKLVRTSNEKVS